MYAFIKGTIVKQTANVVVVDTGNVGYQLLTPNPFVFHSGDVATIFTYQHVREDAIELYGFATEAEKELFLKLISVKGIGPKGAMAMLATGNVDGIIAAIDEGNADYLRKFPGIGPKASQQIVLDLRGKLAIEPVLSANLADVSDVLQSLGYSAKEIQRALKALPAEGDVDVLVKQALQAMLS
jgi:Holliday junction DNA helicase RuvA